MEKILHIFWNVCPIWYHKSLRSSNIGRLSVVELALFFGHCRYFQSLLDNSRNKSGKIQQSIIVFNY